MATYRNSYANYYSDKTGNHSPVGSILPVFADVNLNSNDPEYTYPQHLYCDGKELNIRDYPELYSIIGTQYGGSVAVNKTAHTQPGGLRRSFVYNNKVFFQFYYDPTNDKVNVKRPYPDNTLLRFLQESGSLGSFPSNEAFNTTTFYRLRTPEGAYQTFLDGDVDEGINLTELNWINSQAQTNEFAYFILLPDTVDMSTYNAADYTWDFTQPIGPPIHPKIGLQKSFQLRDYPYNIGTFNLPDYRQRKILGFGTVNGAGTATPENAVNNFVGQTGGRWYIAKNTVIDSGEFFTLGDIKTTGYNTITADVPAYAIGSVDYQIGPIQDYVFPFPPEHTHRMLTVEVDETKQAELGAAEVDKYAVAYLNSRANVNLFEPAGVGGQALGHSHGLIGEALQNSLTATYGNSEGIGDRVSFDSTDPNYTQYLISESPTIVVTSMTYDIPTQLITVNTDGAHGFSVGDVVTVSGALPVAYSGNFTIGSDSFSNIAFTASPRDGETPASSPATGNITVKLANGYFVEQESTANPKAYVIDGSTLVGGKQTEFEIPGNAIIVKDLQYVAPTSVNVDAPPESDNVVFVEISLVAPGGGGADQDTDGQDGQDCSCSFFVDGTFYTITAEGGKGGKSGNSGGAGGQGGSVSVPAALLSDSRFSITTTNGDAGNSGGMTGNGQNDVYGGGVNQVEGVEPGSTSTGGTGTSIAKSQVNNGIFEQQWETNGSWSVPAAAENELSRTIELTISGGGGGSGNGNANSDCVGQWPGWPYTYSGKFHPTEGADKDHCGGYAGRGERIFGNTEFTSGTISWQIGSGGNPGKNDRSGNNATGTTGTNPLTGVAWGPPFTSGVGTGTENSQPHSNDPSNPFGSHFQAGGGNVGVQGAGGTISGQGARGAWGNGGTAGSGGGVTGVYYNGVLLAGAGGGGGGGGSGGGFNGGNTTDPCYKGGDAQPATQGLVIATSALDFASGVSGGSAGCSAGGGGGGGSGCGVTGQAGLGGEGGTAGIGHNGNGGGKGGTAGVSAVRSDIWGSGGFSLDSLGADPCRPGYVKIKFSNVTEYYDPVGGAGGQGGRVSIQIQNISPSAVMSLGNQGQGGGSGTNGGNGYMKITYSGQEEGTTVPGTITSPAGRVYECDSAGNPTGSSQAANIWQSSTDENMKPRNFGIGTGSTAGFSGSGIPQNGGGQISKYLPFTGAATDALGKRQYEVGPFDMTNVNNIRFTMIRGSGQNGGEEPSQQLDVYYRKGGSNNSTLFESISLPASDTAVGWQAKDFVVGDTSQIKDAVIYLIFEQNRTGEYQTSSPFDDNYGLGAITLFYAPTFSTTFISTGGATLQGNLNAAGEPVNSDTGIDQVRRTVTALDASLQINDGTFTMSSSTPITTTATVTAENDIPLITKYHRVKYLIKAL